MSLIKSLQSKNINIIGIIDIGTGKGSHIGEYFGIGNIILLEPEPSKFEYLKNNFTGKALLHRVAITDFGGNASLYISPSKGEYDSILVPKPAFYKSEGFSGVVSVPALPLDRVKMNIGLYNVLRIDAGGAEFFALKGAVSTLQSISAIYMKVDGSKNYENGSTEFEISQFLEGFRFAKVETSEDGFVLYIKQNAPIKKSDDKSNSISAAVSPAESFVKEATKYMPPVLQNGYLVNDNDNVVRVKPAFRLRNDKLVPGEIDFEAWYFENFKEQDQTVQKMYLPIMWSAFANRYSSDTKNWDMAKQHLQGFINGLDKTKKYYTICDNKDGIYVDVSGIDLEVIVSGINDIDTLLNSTKKSIIEKL